MDVNLDKGFHILHNFIDHDVITQINESIPKANDDEKRGGIRGIEKKSLFIEKFIFSEKMLSVAKNCLNSKPNVVRAILFNKTIENNWMVPWHQDKTIAVSEKFTLEGWGPWSIKNGVLHVQPPLKVLENMITLRLHLDDANKENGCLKVIPYSHQYGIVNHAEIQRVIGESSYVDCEGNAGSMLIMKPHIFHASSKVPEPSQRRVLHVEYSCFQLPQGISWV